MPTSPLDENVVVGRKPSLIVADVDQEAILLDVDSGYFFQLNKTAARIWSLLEAPRPVAELVGELGKTFAVGEEECRGDVLEFVTDMRDRGLLVAQ